jgi:carbon starvation protein CstA
MGLLIWQMENVSGFNVLWGYFGWANQALSVFTLWTLTVYLAKNRPAYFWVTLIPALFMTAVCTSFIMISKTAFGLAPEVGFSVAAVVCVVLLGVFLKWKVSQKGAENVEE